MIVNAEGQVMGRLSSEIASKLLDGEEIKILNCEKAVISGRPDGIIESYLQKRDIGGPEHGPYSSLRPEKILRDSIKGMLPMKKKRGRDALSRLDVVRGNQDDEEGGRLSKGKDDLKTNYITLEELSERIGGR